ncbi:MAG: hypothetical protein JSU77_06735 [Fidelibacterota bacterium]|nr:MAG: hypothetical protein JSU77_06735 [Candidatus Neomarinimicrobiota bacterium]
MKNIQILTILTVLSALSSQELNQIHRGTDYFTVEPGKTWYIDTVNREGQLLSAYRRYTIESHTPKGSVQIPVKVESFFLGTILFQWTEIYRVNPDGGIDHEKTVRNGRLENYDPPRIYLPAELKLGSRWSYSEPTGDVYISQVMAFIDTLSLPNGLIVNDVVKIKKDWTSENGELRTSLFQYFADGMGYVGMHFSGEGWVEVRRP